MSSIPVTRHHRHGRPDQAGFTTLELIGALSIMAIAFFALAGAMGLGLRSVALGRQRQGATDIGNARIEHLRNVPYANVALSTAPVHSSEPDDPDYFIDDSSFDYTGGGTYEPLVVDTTDGQVLHNENPVLVGETTLSVYQYVTWVDDPGVTGTQDYKRLTVVVRNNQPAVSGVSRLVRVSTFFTEGTVTVGGANLNASTGSSSTPTATPTPSPTSGSCAGDTSVPAGSFVIETGTAADDGFSPSSTVTLRFTNVADACTPIRFRFSNDGTTYGTDVQYDVNSPGVSWTLTTGDGTKQVWGKLRDGAGNEKTLGPLAIIVDTQAPSVPGALSRTLFCSGNNRTASLAWGSSTDTNFRGYRVYKSINGSAYTELVTVSGTTRDDTDLKTYDSVRYKVVGYDSAGNESTATNAISLAKNQCS